MGHYYGKTQRKKRSKHSVPHSGRSSLSHVASQETWSGWGTLLEDLQSNSAACQEYRDEAQLLLLQEQREKREGRSSPSKNLQQKYERLRQGVLGCADDALPLLRQVAKKSTTSKGTKATLKDYVRILREEHAKDYLSNPSGLFWAAKYMLKPLGLAGKGKDMDSRIRSLGERIAVIEGMKKALEAEGEPVSSWDECANIRLRCLKLLRGTYNAGLGCMTAVSAATVAAPMVIAGIPGLTAAGTVIGMAHSLLWVAGAAKQGMKAREKPIRYRYGLV